MLILEIEMRSCFTMSKNDMSYLRQLFRQFVRSHEISISLCFASTALRQGAASEAVLLLVDYR